jgi:O-antigen/teichoic acid export membrane protein
LTATGGAAGAAASAVAVGAASSVLAKLVHFALNVVASLALIRYLGPTGFGDYVFAFGFAALFGLLSDFGLTKVAVRDMSRDDRAASAVLGTSVATRFALAILCAVVAQFALLPFGMGARVHVAVALASMLFAVEALLSVTALFQVRLVMQYEATVLLLVQVLDTALILWLVSRDAGLLAVVAAPVVCSLLGLVLAAWLARSRFHARFTIEPRRAFGLVREAWPLGLTALLAVVYLKADSVLLGVLATPADVGIYGAAYKPVEYLFLAIGMIVNAMFPLLARSYGNDVGRFEIVYQRGTDVLLAIALPIAVGVALLAGPIVGAMYDSEFTAAAGPLQILCVGLVFMLLGTWQGFAMLAARRQRVVLACNAAALVLNLVLNLSLIPRFGYIGAAASALCTSVFIGILTGAVASRFLHVSIDGMRVARVLLANAMFGAGLWVALALGLPWVAASVAAGTLYAASLLLVRATSLGELRILIPTRRPIVAAEAR